MSLRLNLIGLALLGSFVAAAQSSPHGAYYLRGVREMASGFNFLPDSTFEFFYTYGALDRYGKGHWSQQGNDIILNSEARPPVDFKLLNQSHRAGDSLTIRIRDNNEVLLRYVKCRIRTAAGIVEIQTDEQGYARFAGSGVDSLALLFTLCPDRYSTFAVASGDNYFEFGFEPWIVEVFFDHFVLHPENGELKGPHPLMPGGTFRYSATGQP